MVDKFDASGWNLFAEDKKDPTKFLIYKSRGNTGKFCSSLSPVSAFLANDSSYYFTMVFLCYKNGSFYYDSQWGHKGYSYELIGHNVSQYLFISNLLNAVVHGYEFDSRAVTSTNNLTISPKKITIKKNGKYSQDYIELHGTKYCVFENGLYTQIQDGRPNNTEMYINLIPTKERLKLDIIPGKECILKVLLPEKLQPGTYKFLVLVDALKRITENELTVEKE